MKKTLLSIALVAASGTALAGDFYNGRLTGMSGAGVVTGNYVDGILANPSLGASYADNDDFAIAINAGAMGSDQDDLLDGLDEAVDFLDYLSSIQDVQDLDAELAEEAKVLLQNIDAKTAQIGVGGSLVLAIPNDVISIALVAKTRIDASVTSFVDENDYELLDSSVNQPFDPADLQSSVMGIGAMVTEVGVSLSRSLGSDSSSLLVGITPKRVTVETFIYNAQVNNFDEDEFDAEEFTRESSATSFDAGVTYVAGNLRYGLVVRDAISNEFDTISGEKYVIESQSTAAIGYHNSWFTAEVALDLDAVPSFSMNGDVRLFRAGIELDVWNWLQVRAGMEQDLENTLEDTYSVGLGISPFDVVNLDLAAVKGQHNTLGGAIQLGIRF